MLLTIKTSFPMNGTHCHWLALKLKLCQFVSVVVLSEDSLQSEFSWRGRGVNTNERLMKLNWNSFGAKVHWTQNRTSLFWKESWTFSILDDKGQTIAWKIYIVLAYHTIFRREIATRLLCMSHLCTLFTHLCKVWKAKTRYKLTLNQEVKN